MLAQIIRIKAHILRVRVPLNLLQGIHIFKFKFSFTLIRTRANEGFYSLFSLYQLIYAEVTNIVIATLALEHAIKVTQTDWAVVLKLVTLLSFLGQEVTALHIF